MNNSRNKTVKQIVLELEKENRIDYNISHRGGTYGAASKDVVAVLFPTLLNSYSNNYQKVITLLPSKIGVHCNYLGGGLRSTINRSDYAKELPAKYARRIDSFTRECKARYLAIESGAGLNNEEYEDGETNWDAIGTNKSRVAGVKSGY